MNCRYNNSSLIYFKPRAVRSWYHWYITVFLTWYTCSSHSSIGFIAHLCVVSVADVPVSRTGRGWQPTQISSWSWCICWNETLSPAPASGGLYKLLCTSPSFLFYLRSQQKWNKISKKQLTLHLLYYSFVCLFLFKLSAFIFAGWPLRWKIPTVETCRPRRAYRDVASLLGCFSNLHLFCFGFRNANWAVLSGVFSCTTVTFKKAAIRSSTLASWKATTHKKVHKLLCLSPFMTQRVVKTTVVVFTGLLSPLIRNIHEGKSKKKYSEL